MFVTPLVLAVLAAAENPPVATAEPAVASAITLDGAWTDGLDRYVWAHDPSTERFPALASGGGGGLAVELGLGGAWLPHWLEVAVGARLGFGSWAGSVPAESASLAELGLTGRFELQLGRVRPWVGFTTSVGNVWASVDGRERQLVLHSNGLTAGLRVLLSNAWAVGLFAQTHNASSLARPQEVFFSNRVGLDLTVALGGPRRR